MCGSGVLTGSGLPTQAYLLQLTPRAQLQETQGYKKVDLSCVMPAIVQGIGQLLGLAFLLIAQLVTLGFVVRNRFSLPVNYFLTL